LVGTWTQKSSQDTRPTADDAGVYTAEKKRKNRELSRDPESSEQFVELNRGHRDIETQLARSSASLSMIPIGSQVASI
jgi:hypothetical protein